ncbi:serine hydrolase domain-containing protein [Georgenia thermotolerans]|uniref:serine hydrolase domain-containing protein n=1 Tax=Georgenia thermotolerans TaxID=527326 RepID=UPI001478D3FD|nr:serine hydrolase domain-containing protein [Georgenia thermotolerans]
MTTPPAGAPRTLALVGDATGGFESVPEVLARLVALEGARGGALCVYHQGRVVVDVTVGDYAPDGLQLVFSVSKALTALVAARAHERGELDLDAPLAEHWPELARPATAAITARMVLGHRSGLASLDRDLTLEEVLAGADDAEIARQQPYWEPGTAHGYHAFTFGTLMNGLFRRALGTSVGEALQRHVAEPVGAEVWLGAPTTVHSRVERIDPSPAATTAHRAEWAAASGIPGSTTARIARFRDLYNDPALWAACLPSTSGIASARGLAAVFSAALDGRTLLGHDALARLLRPEAEGVDRVLGVPIAFGSGVQLPFPQLPLLGPGSFGHEAAGGSAVAADPASGLVVAWTTPKSPAMVGASATFLGILATLRHCLERRRPHPAPTKGD